MAEKSLERTPLEDVMVAMDVVDTLRHRQELVDRELNAEARRERLIERLRDIYRDQGIEVTDSALRAGVQALEEERFIYRTPPPSWRLRLARWYVTRSGWGKPALVLAGLGFGLWLLWYVLIGLPAARERAELPTRLGDAFSRIVQISEEPDVTERARRLLEDGRAAIGADNYERGERLTAELETLKEGLEQTYTLRIVSRPNELSGVWRVPGLNPSARNYYLIVEALDSARRRVRLPIESEEDGKIHQVSTWGVRVDEQTFEAVAADKRDDGIIQGDLVGRKVRGRLTPDYDIPTLGGYITEW